MRFENVRVRFGDKTVLENFSAETGGGAACVTGPSGRGKTTLLRLAAGLISPDSGRVVDMPRKPAFMFQEDRLLPWLTAGENVAAVLPQRDAPLAAEWLRRVELSGEADAYPEALSGGMRRRVALARALAYGGDMLILDEPFKGLDAPLLRRLLPLITDSGVPVLVSTHSEEEMALLGGKILRL